MCGVELPSKLVGRERGKTTHTKRKRKKKGGGESRESEEREKRG